MSIPECESETERSFGEVVRKMKNRANVQALPEKSIVSQRLWGEFTEVVWSDGTVTLHRPTDENTTIRFPAGRANP